jgi:hypothetical protein
LDGFGLGISGAGDEAAALEGHEEEVGGDDLREPADGAPEEENGGERGRGRAGEEELVSGPEKECEGKAVEVADKAGGVDRERQADLALDGGAPGLEGSGRQRCGNPDGGKDHCALPCAG